MSWLFFVLSVLVFVVAFVATIVLFVRRNDEIEPPDDVTLLNFWSKANDMVEQQERKEYGYVATGMLTVLAAFFALRYGLRIWGT